jgi:hypothetical protein
MRYLTKEQARCPKRQVEPLDLPEYSAPLLLAKPSASLAVRLRESNANFASAETIRAMVADMLVDEDGAHMFSADDVPAFLEGISAESLRTIAERCFAMFSGKGGAPGNPKPSTSA